MKVGVKVNAPLGPVTWPQTRDMAAAADAGGLDSVWSEDHHFEPFGGPHDLWTTLAALAAITERVQLAPIVASTNYYPSPVILARKAAAIHEISGGRLILGLGAGSGDFEYAKLGLPFDRPVSRFAEAFEILRRLLAGERFSYEGEFHTLEDTWLSPVHRPAPRESSSWLDSDWATQPTAPLDIPIMAGSLGPRMLGITLPHASGWNVHWTDRPFWNHPEQFPDVAAHIATHAAAAGRKPDELWASAEVWAQTEEAQGLPMRAPDDLTPLPLSIETLRRCDAAGIDHLIVLIDPQTPTAVERLAATVGEYRAAAT